MLSISFTTFLGDRIIHVKEEGKNQNWMKDVGWKSAVVFFFRGGRDVSGHLNTLNKELQCRDKVITLTASKLSELHFSCGKIIWKKYFYISKQVAGSSDPSNFIYSIIWAII
jgi:hypothetical protein